MLGTAIECEKQKARRGVQVHGIILLFVISIIVISIHWCRSHTKTLSQFHKSLLSCVQLQDGVVIPVHVNKAKESRQEDRHDKYLSDKRTIDIITPQLFEHQLLKSLAAFGAPSHISRRVTRSSFFGKGGASGNASVFTLFIPNLNPPAALWKPKCCCYKKIIGFHGVYHMDMAVMDQIPAQTSQVCHVLDLPSPSHAWCRVPSRSGTWRAWYLEERWMDNKIEKFGLGC